MFTKHGGWQDPAKENAVVLMLDVLLDTNAQKAKFSREDLLNIRAEIERLRIALRQAKLIALEVEKSKNVPTIIKLTIELVTYLKEVSLI